MKVNTGIIAWSIVLIEKLIVAQFVKTFPALYTTRRFIAARETA